jgi:hypothetical protein
MISKKQQTSIASKKNFKPCPEKLENLISTLNLIPPNETLWGLNIGSQKLILNYRLHLEALQDLKNKIENYSIEFQQFIYGRDVDFKKLEFYYWSSLPDLDVWETYYALKRYEDFNENRNLLRGIIKNFSSSLNKVGRQMPYLLKPQTRIEIDEEGKIHFSFDEFTEALQGIEISRIRVCENCSQIFWQGRTTQKGCNPKCASNIRVKKSRELKRKKRDEYEFNSYSKETSKNKKS